MINAPEPKARVQSVDALRGAVMIIMALDHVRDFYHAAALSFSPENLSRTTPAIFFTRWITHFCAPTFMFTAGIGAFLWWQRGRTKGELSRFLWTRGLWLIVLEFTVVRLALYFNFDYTSIFLLVFWVLGGSMIALSALVWLPFRVLAAVSILVIASHNLLDSVKPSQFGAAAGLWNIIHQPGAFPFAGHLVLVGYPLVPWFAVMAAGFCFGPVISNRPWMIRIGAGLTIAFLVIRTANIYGDPQPWSGSVLSFLNCSKYPPSLDFLLMTLGPAILTMAWLERFRFGSANPLIVFGRVPLFFFIVHFYAIHWLAVLLAFLRYGRASFMFNPLPTMGGPRQLFPSDYGYDLWAVYLIWFGIVAFCYPLCAWFARVKQRRKNWWLSYI